MNGHRANWARQVIGRDNRVVDTQINASLQNGTAFFASTSLIALGSVLTLSRSGRRRAEPVRDAALRHGGEPPDLGTEGRRTRGGLRVRLLQVRLGLSAVQLHGHPARRRAIEGVRGERHRDAAGGAPSCGHERQRRAAFRPRPAGLLLRARLSRLVRESLRPVRLDDRGRDHHVAAAIRLGDPQGAARGGRGTPRGPVSRMRRRKHAHDRRKAGRRGDRDDDAAASSRSGAPTRPSARRRWPALWAARIRTAGVR